MTVQHISRRITMQVLCAGFVLLAIALPAQEHALLRTPEWQIVTGYHAPPATRGRSMILIEAGNHTVLATENPHLVLPAASLSKVVAIHAALVADQQFEFDIDQEFSPPPEAWAVNQEPGSSLMFLGPGQTLTGNDLLKGLAISSGNDAAVALALRVDGSALAFAGRMTQVVREAGLVTSSFVEPSGLSPLNLITAYEYGAFLQTHISRFPSLLADIYSLPGYTYPQPQHMTGQGEWPPIAQGNRNLLVGTYPGADGIKTGYIDESGYHLAATAERDGRRLIAVVLGVAAASHAEGGRVRAEDAQALLDYGFTRFDLLRFGSPPLDPVRVFKGDRVNVVPTVPSSLAVSVPAGAASRLLGQADYLTELVAPVAAGTKIGSLTVLLDGVVVGEASVTMPGVETGGFFRRLWDGLSLVVRSLFGRERPADGSMISL